MKTFLSVMIPSYYLNFERSTISMEKDHAWAIALLKVEVSEEDEKATCFHM